MKPKVLLLHNFMSPYRVPLFAELARRMDFEVWILGDVRSIREWPEHVPAGAFPWRRLPHIGLPLGSRDYRLLLNPTVPLALPRHEADVVIFAGWDTPAALCGAWQERLRHRRPYIVWSGSTAGEPNWRRRLFHPLVRRMVRGASAWLAYGTRAREYLLGLGAQEEGVFCAFNTVDVRAFANAAGAGAAARETLRGRLGIRTPHVILYCGQLIARKGLDDLLPAFAAFHAERRDVTLLVVGSGPGRERYERMAAAAGVGEGVRFTGFVPRDELPSLYALADLFALPSREEVWGLVLNEALACGTPVLATTACGATPDLVQDGVNGYAVPPRDTNAILGVLHAHFAPGANRPAMAAAARNSIAPFTIERAADAFEAAVAHALR